MARKIYHNPPPTGDIPADAPAEAVKREFAKRLGAAMVERGWNQSELARQASRHMPHGKSIGRDSISGYYRGENIPGPVHLDAISKALGKRPQELLPTRGVPSADTKQPALETRDVGGGKAWLRVNQAVPWDVAMKIMALLKPAGGDD